MMRLHPTLYVPVYWLCTTPIFAGEPSLTNDLWPGQAPGETGSIGPERYFDQRPGEKPVKRPTNITELAQPVRGMAPRPADPAACSREVTGREACRSFL